MKLKHLKFLSIIEKYTGDNHSDILDELDTVGYKNELRTPLVNVMMYKAHRDVSIFALRSRCTLRSFEVHQFYDKILQQRDFAITDCTSPLSEKHTTIFKKVFYLNNIQNKTIIDVYLAYYLDNDQFNNASVWTHWNCIKSIIRRSVSCRCHGACDVCIDNVFKQLTSEHFNAAKKLNDGCRKEEQKRGRKVKCEIM